MCPVLMPTALDEMSSLICSKARSFELIESGGATHNDRNQKWNVAWSTASTAKLGENFKQCHYRRANFPAILVDQQTSVEGSMLWKQNQDWQYAVEVRPRSCVKTVQS